MRFLALLSALVACREQPPASLAPDGDPVGTSPPVPLASSAPAPTGHAEIAVLVPGRFEVTSATPLKTVARLERRGDDGAWAPLADLDLGAGYRLLERCGATPPACVDASHLQPPRWSGMSCSAQCNATCRANLWLGPGTFRLVAEDCTGTGESAGPSFELPGAELSEDRAFERWALATGFVRGTAVRLDQRAAFDAHATGAGLLAGFTERAGTEAALAPAELPVLAALLRDAKGFEDRVVKRCVTGTLVGVRIQRDIPTTGSKRTEPLEIALDLSCARYFAARGEGAHRVVASSYFDPSRPAFLALAKRLLPADAQVAKEH